MMSQTFTMGLTAHISGQKQHSCKIRPAYQQFFSDFSRKCGLIPEPVAALIPRLFHFLSRGSLIMKPLADVLTCNVPETGCISPCAAANTLC
jgi:hypothetical protein